MAISSTIFLENNRSGSGKYKPLRKEEDTQEEEKLFAVDDDLKAVLDAMDRASIRTTFKQATDPIHLAFKYIDDKPLSRLAKEFVTDSATDFIEFVSRIFI